MRTKYKQWAVDYLEEHPEIVLNKIDLKNNFFQRSQLIFEVGSGKGDFALSYSKSHPESNFLAIERVKTVAGIMAKKLVENKCDNVLVFPNNAEIIFSEIDKGIANKIFLNFVDPWPKKRHEKRRLTYITFLNDYYRILKKGGFLIFKSDNDGLYEYTKEELKLTKFKIISDEEKYAFDKDNDAMTEYENKFRLKGQNIHRIIVQK